MVIGGAAMIGYFNFAHSVLHTQRPWTLASICSFRGPESDPRPGFPGFHFGAGVPASVSRIISSVQYTMSHNGDSREERDGDERPETVSIGELLRSAHEISHRSIRHLPV